MDFGKDRVYEAWKVIKNGYCKILLINLTEDTYYPILINDAEWYQHPPLSLSAFCQWFIDNNYIYPDDVGQFNNFWYNTKGYVEYRRKVGDDWEWVVLDTTPTANRTTSNEEYILCVSPVIY